MARESKQARAFSEYLLAQPAEFEQLPVYNHWKSQAPAETATPKAKATPAKPAIVFVTRCGNDIEDKSHVFALPPRDGNQLAASANDLKSLFLNCTNDIVSTLKRKNHPATTGIIKKSNINIVADILLESDRNSNPAAESQLLDALSARSSELTSHNRAVERDLDLLNHDASLLKNGVKKETTTAIRYLQSLREQLAKLGVDIEAWEQPPVGQKETLEYADAYGKTAKKAILEKMQSIVVADEEVDHSDKRQMIVELLSPELPFIPNPALFSQIATRLNHASGDQQLSTEIGEQISAYETSFNALSKQLIPFGDSERDRLFKALEGKTNRDKLRTLVKKLYAAPTPSATIEMLGEYIDLEQNHQPKTGKAADEDADLVKNSTVNDELADFVLTKGYGVGQPNSISEILGDEFRQYHIISQRNNAYLGELADGKSPKIADKAASDLTRTRNFSSTLSDKLAKARKSGEVHVRTLLRTYHGAVKSVPISLDIFMSDSDSPELRAAKLEAQRLVDAAFEHNGGLSQPKPNPQVATPTVAKAGTAIDGPSANG